MLDKKFFNKKVDYFWEYEYSFGEYFLKSIFGDKYKTKYSKEGNGIYNLIYGEDGKIYEVKFKKALKKIVPDDLLSRNTYQNTIMEKIAENIKGEYEISKNKFMTFNLGNFIAKIEIVRKMKEPV